MGSQFALLDPGHHIVLLVPDSRRLQNYVAKQRPLELFRALF